MTAGCMAQPRASSHAMRAKHQRLAKLSRCAIVSIVSPTKAWISSASASFARNAARAQIEQQLLVERAGGGAMAALHVVGKDFQLRLVVGFGLVRQQQRIAHHLGVGLLRVRLDDDLALEHGAALAIEHRAEPLAAVAAQRGVLDEQRGVDVLLATEQADAADRRFGVLRRQSGRKSGCAPARYRR